jgi:putative hydrolase of the HAD superfamily
MDGCNVQISVKPLADIQAVTFDAGGTLISPRPSVGHIYAEVAKRHGLGTISPDLLNHNFAAAWQAKKNFNHTRSDWSQLVQKTFSQLTPQPPTDAFFDNLYDRFAEASCWTIHDDVLPTLEELRGRDIRCAVVSNWDERLQILLPRLGLTKYFETIVVSCEVGFAKPSGVIFEYALRKLGLPAGSVLHVGDSFCEDVWGARAAGMQALLIDRKGDDPHAGGIRSLQEISGMIE